MLEKIIRGDHAGELNYNYERQMAILRNNKRAAPLIQDAGNHENVKKFKEFLITYNAHRYENAPVHCLLTKFTGCPNIKLALGKLLELGLHGFLMGIFNPQKDLLSH